MECPKGVFETSMNGAGIDYVSVRELLQIAESLENGRRDEFDFLSCESYETVKRITN